MKEFSSSIVLVAGLGNPGAEYASTRHNVGFMIIDRVLEKLNVASDGTVGCNSIFYKLKYKGKNVIFAKPQTFMNLSGNAVISLMNREMLELKNLLVIHDELDLPLGRMRIRNGGSSGGHNGINSIIDVFEGKQNFMRMRIGIGRDRNVIDYVLGKFDADEQVLLEKVIDCAADAVIELLKAPASAVMTRCNALDLSESTQTRES